MSHVRGMRALRAPAITPSHGCQFQSHFILRARLQASSQRQQKDPNRLRQFISIRHASTAAAEARKSSPSPSTPSTLVSQPIPSTKPVPLSKASTPDLQTLNPPASTRPPPLNLPTRGPDSSTFTHLFSVGKAYAVFYKTGLKAIWSNWKLLRSPSGSSAPAPETRAHILFRERVRHDVARLPVFALIVLVFGEFTPFVILLFPRLAPHTCRVPRQLQKMRQRAEERRAQSFRALSRFAVRAPAHSPNKSVQPSIANQSALSKGNDVGSLFTPSGEWEAALPGHIVRTLGLGSPLWDKAGFDAPMARSKADSAVNRLAKDDDLIRQGGGVRGLEGDEVIIAAEERGLDVIDKKESEMRVILSKWLELTNADGERAAAERKRRIRMLLGIRPEEWKGLRL